MSRRELNMAAFMLALLLIGSAFLFTHNKLPEIRQTRATIDETRDTIANRNERIAQRAEYSYEFERLQASLPVYPLRKNVSSELYGQVESMAEKTGLTLLGLDAEDDEVMMGDVHQMEMDCTFRGTGESLSQFLYLAQSRGGALDISYLKWEPKPREPGIIEGRFTMDCAFRRKDIPAKIMPKPGANPANPATPSKTGSTSAGSPAGTAANTGTPTKPGTPPAPAALSGDPVASAAASKTPASAGTQAGPPVPVPISALRNPNNPVGDRPSIPSRPSSLPNRTVNLPSTATGTSAAGAIAPRPLNLPNRVRTGTVIPADNPTGTVVPNSGSSTRPATTRPVTPSGNPKLPASRFSNPTTRPIQPPKQTIVPSSGGSSTR